MRPFQNKENLKPADRKARSKANLFDMFVFLLVIIFAINLANLPYYVRIAVVASYVLIINPFSMSIFGGTPGQIFASLRVRKYNDYEKNVSIIEAFLRFILLLVNYFIGILSFSDKNKFVFEKASNTQTLELDLSDEKMAIISKNHAYRRFALYGGLYLAWVVWLGNFWFVLGLPIIFDLYVSKKVNWSPWKKRDGNNNIIVEWLDALIFAVVAVTIINIFLFQNYKIPTGSMEKSLQIGDHLYVSKVAFGPRIPMTPLALPFMQHSLPGSTKKSYLEWPKWDYKRLKGFGKVKRWDPVVFNFPAGDTVCLDEQNRSYDAIVRDKLYNLMNIDEAAKRPLKTYNEYYNEARKAIRSERDIVVRPIDKKDNYIKRCVAIPGDSLEVREGIIYINGEIEPYFPGRQKTYIVNTGGKYLNAKRLRELGIYDSDIINYGNLQIMTLSEEVVEKIKQFRSVVSVERFREFERPHHNVFPHDYARDWSQDNFGPIYLPEEGATVEINMETLPLYKRIIGTYEGNKLEVKDSTIYINGEIADSYTFKMDYYWMMGDNRHSSLDSRFWGYVPENHIIGKPKFIWLSLHKEKKFPANIQLKRMFRKVK